MPQPLDVSAYIAAAAEASDRSRWTIVTVAFASVIVFAAFWNSRADAWLPERLQEARCAMQSLNLTPTELSALSAAERELFAKCDAAVKKRGIATKEGVKIFTEALTRATLENAVLVRAPIFGIAFDVNDLGILGGFALSVILLMLQYSLARELDNLRLTFARAKRDGCERDCYDLLAMQQVMTVPPTHTRPVLGFIGKRIGRVLFGLPILVQSAVVYHDWRTRAIPWVLNPSHAEWVLVAGAFFAVVILLLTIQCVRLARATTKEWREQAELLGVV